MRTSSVSWLVAALFFLAIGSACSADALNSGDFNSPDNESWDNAGWQGHWGSCGRPSWAEREGTGRGVAAYGWGSGEGVGFFQDVPATAGVTYTFSIWVKKEPNYSENYTHLKIEWLDSSHAQLGDTISTNIAGQSTSTYGKFAISGSTTNPACAFARAVVMTEWTTPTNNWWATMQFDDASLVAEPGTVIQISSLLIVLTGMIVAGPLWRGRRSKQTNNSIAG